MEGTNLYLMAKFTQEELERAAREERYARQARLPGQIHTINFKSGFSLRRLFARQR